MASKLSLQNQDMLAYFQANSSETIHVMTDPGIALQALQSKAHGHRYKDVSAERRRMRYR